MTGDWSFFKLIILLSVGQSSAELCDRASRAQKQEGNLGQSADFNWLGVLHVQLNELIATSGIVLIKIKYALVNADDVARIPQHIFRLHSKAMFLPTRDKPWFVNLTSYVIHPEYELSNINTIALIELNLDGVDEFPLSPICLAKAKTFNASKYLYLTGFTHENDKLEKVIYKIQYLDKKICEEFYNKSELSSQKPMPFAQLCGYAPNSASQCIWDNGMTLLSNSFGYLHLVGFGVHGPGCSAPARFIDLFSYFSWINSTTSFTPSNLHDNRQDFVPNKSGRRKSFVENVPIHELFKVTSRRQLSQVIDHKYEAYPKQLYETEFHLIEPAADDRTFFISAAKDSWERNESACAMPKTLIYHEMFQLKASDKLWGSVTYKLSMYDTHYAECICVRLRVAVRLTDKGRTALTRRSFVEAFRDEEVEVDCHKRSDFIIKFKEILNYKEDTENDDILGHGTPEEIFRYYPEQNIKETEPDNKYLRPSYIKDDDLLIREGLNYDLYITFKFLRRGKLRFEMFAPQLPISRKTTTTTTTTTTTSTTSAIEETTQESEVIRRGKTKVKVKQKSRWGVDNWVEASEAEVSVAEWQARGTQAAPPLAR